MAETKRVEIGFGGGQVVALRLTQERLGELRSAVERGGGWFELKAEDGEIALELSQVSFVRVEGGPHTIGFSGA